MAHTNLINCTLRGNSQDVPSSMGKKGRRVAKSATSHMSVLEKLIGNELYHETRVQINQSCISEQDPFVPYRNPKPITT